MFGIVSQIKLALIVAAVVGALGLVGGIYLKGYYAAKSAAEVSELREVVMWHQRTAALAQEASKRDAEAVKAKEAEIAATEILIEELEHETLSDPCLNAADVDRLRKLFGKAFGHKPTTK